MDNPHTSHWRSMFDKQRQERPSGGFGLRPASPPPAPPQHVGYDDGHDPARQGTAPLSPQAITDQAVMALADDNQDYRPWILQRGTRAPLMLHLRRFDAQARHWLGWQVNYAHLAAVEYVGTRLVSLDCGARHFVLEGCGLGELVDHLQGGVVQCAQEYAPSLWSSPPTGAVVTRIQSIGQLQQGG